MVFVNAPVGEDNDIGAFCICAVDTDKELVEGALQLCVFKVTQRNDSAFKARLV